MNDSGINYFSIFGKYFAVNSGTDAEEIVEEPPELLVFDGGHNIPNFDYDSYLKVSYPTNGLELDGVTVRCGKENVLDMDHVFDCYIYGSFGSNKKPGKQIITIKGGSSDITVEGKILCHGKLCDVTIGDWSDQSSLTSRDIVINLKSSDGRPVKVRIGRAADVKLLGDCKKSYLQSIMLKIHWWKKYFTQKFSKE